MLEWNEMLYKKKSEGLQLTITHWTGDYHPSSVSNQSLDKNLDTDMHTNIVRMESFIVCERIPQKCRVYGKNIMIIYRGEFLFADCSFRYDVSQRK
jgi:hypothetical protein